MESVEGNNNPSNLYLDRYSLDGNIVLARGRFGPIKKGFDTKWKVGVAITTATPFIYNDIFELERFKAVLHEIRILKIVSYHPNVIRKILYFYVSFDHCFRRF
jgi:hypothetical protein